MNNVITVINSLLAFAGVVTFIWMIVGLPVGVVLLILYFIEKEPEKKKKLMKWIKRCFASLLVLLAIMLLYALMGFLGTVTGVKTSLPIPGV